MHSVLPGDVYRKNYLYTCSLEALTLPNISHIFITHSKFHMRMDENKARNEQEMAKVRYLIA